MFAKSFPLNPFLESVADRIRERVKGLTGVESLELAPDLKNIYGKTDGEDFFIFNELHQSRGFRKLHIETAVFEPSLEILHVVFFPDPAFDLPIFGVDLIAVPQGISAAIVDLSPVRDKLPRTIENQLAQIEIPSFEKVRKLPDWGDIFSSHVQFITPIGAEENGFFLDLVDKFLTILIDYSESIEPDLDDSPFTIERIEGQMYYCLQQKQNDKTRNVLAKAFSPNWANQYIEMVLFDMPVHTKNLDN
ncbi:MULTISPECIES: phycocyanobilin:ferredoxin oxidoreductase [Prochlorococcus]|uniref:Phycocyanobilin:ferredoxin oxidoreductase n=1 Tax=Prochlorococcus marinus (strain SARG / CCMP1375 / SS120) TaxID=167539 RepID=PCYA_PROMA|nr:MULTISPECIES: phycocyanobilin:ferredoxin oxidoreductase [Prochlorococcus]Q7VCC2.1 RecName: Full=Phycocyanobilin:ferredoxin oxidoreductase [Prochlorococcus marinus subsp. marinus str. CCMP1375]AAP99863.1 Phycocyanobilin:ferredoxin oxidoreductase PcyA [Prochlorococcus marinus subsp. marinus str. CCMP1375]KGG11790.1 Phycocyanobilin:ferredoxin oxidoreductase PcyA [Prochlorococcus marinus str. LG]KGG18796.1 Phycocyanobilin:ferredoxin oxidoreductase PcyA [Prochlorococcus marinus str. SS2]KGG23666